MWETNKQTNKQTHGTIILMFFGHVWLSAFQGDSVRSKGEDLKLQAPLDKINLHLREGSITPTQVNTGFHI